MRHVESHKEEVGGKVRLDETANDILDSRCGCVGSTSTQYSVLALVLASALPGKASRPASVRTWA